MYRENVVLLEKYIDHMVARNKSPKTIKTFRSILNKFIKYIGDKDLKDINIQDIDGFLAFLRRNGYSPKSIYTAAVALKRFLEYHEIIEPLKNFEYPRRPSTLPRFLTYEEVYKMIDVAERIRDKLIIMLLYTTGIRVSELVNIKIMDINFEKNSIRVYGKGGKEREVFFSRHVKPLLKKIIRRRHPTEYLFKSRGDKHISYVTVERIVRKIALKAGIYKKVTPHILRHSFATHALMKGMNLREIQELLGHASLKNTQIYAHIVRRKLYEDYSKIWD